jgi:hypothetical protein
MTNFVVYIGPDEVIVTTQKNEAKMLQICFEDGDRDITEYERDVYAPDHSVSFSSSFSRNW